MYHSHGNDGWEDPWRSKHLLRVGHSPAPAQGGQGFVQLSPANVQGRSLLTSMGTWLWAPPPWSKEGLLMQAWTFEAPACGNCPLLYCLALRRKDWLYHFCKSPLRSHRLLLNSPQSPLGQTKWAQVPPPFLVNHVPQILTILEASTGYSSVSLHPSWTGGRGGTSQHSITSDPNAKQRMTAPLNLLPTLLLLM